MRPMQPLQQMREVVPRGPDVGYQTAADLRLADVDQLASCTSGPEAIPECFGFDGAQNTSGSRRSGRLAPFR